MKGLLVRKRITTLFLFLLLAIIFILLRLFYIQIIQSDFFQRQALSQRLTQLPLEARRGTIYDIRGERLAVSASADTVVAIPVEMGDKEEMANRLARILQMSQEEIYRRITQNVAAIYLERKLDEERAQIIKNLHLPGIIFTEESKRYYPQGDLAAHLLGFAGIDNQGLDGLELSYDEYLQGHSGRILMERDATGREIPLGYQFYQAPLDGSDVYLTIDSVVQYIIERHLDLAMEEHEAVNGIIIAMEPATGRIIALANRPSYEPNDFASYPPRLWRNTAISDNYEPGSTFKAFTLATALELGVVNDNDRFFCPGFVEVADHRIHCWLSSGHGSQSLAEIVENSCNPSFVQLGKRIGRENFVTYIESFGFGSPTGIMLPGEARGMTYSLERMGPVELSTMAFGHGVAVTPIQLISAMAAIANGGVLLQPQLVDRIVSPEDMLLKEFQPQLVRRVISTETAEQVRRLLFQVVEEGSGFMTHIDGYAIGGKTGTAQHYGQPIYDVSFVGFLPVQEPRFIMLVALKGLSSQPFYASQTVVPVFNEIIKDIIRYLDIPPQFPEDLEEEVMEMVEVPSAVQMTRDAAVKMLKEQGLHVRLEGEGFLVQKQFPLPGTSITTGTTVILFFEGGLHRQRDYLLAVPDLMGLRREEVEALLSGLGFPYVMEGEGQVVWQSLEEGTLVQANTLIELMLQ